MPCKIDYPVATLAQAAFRPLPPGLAQPQAGLIAAMSALMRLRTFLSDAHTRGLVGTGLLDREVTDPLLEERMHRLRTQVTAALALRSLLQELEIVEQAGLDDRLDLAPLVYRARTAGILNRREAGILLQINLEANEAKHALFFVSRL